MKRYRAPLPNEQWRNKKTDVVTTIISVPSPGTWNGYVVHKGKRVTHTSEQQFVRKYEFVAEVSA